MNERKGERKEKRKRGERGEEGGEGGREGEGKKNRKRKTKWEKEIQGEERWTSTCRVYVYQCFSPTFLDVRRHVKVSEGEGYVPADLCGEVGVKSKPLQVNAENLMLEKGKSGHIHKPQNWFRNETRMSHLPLAA